MSSKLNDMEQYSRKTNIRINGIPKMGFETAEAYIEGDWDFK